MLQQQRKLLSAEQHYSLKKTKKKRFWNNGNIYSTVENFQMVQIFSYFKNVQTVQKNSNVYKFLPEITTTPNPFSHNNFSSIMAFQMSL